MVDGRRQARLAELRRAHLLQRQAAALQQLQHHRSLQQGVGRQIHDPAATCADLAHEFVLLDCRGAS